MTTANLLIIAGQSNALGFNVSPSELPASYAPSAAVQIWNATTGAFEEMQPGVNTGTVNNPTAWGPEVGEAISWTAAHPGETLYIVKDGSTVHGSTGLAADPTQLDWSPSSTGEMYSTATTDITSAKAALTAASLTPHVIGIDWMQGEQDAIDATKAAAYQTNFGAFLGQIETAWGDGDGTTPVSYGRIDVSDALTFQTDVRAAQDTVAVGNFTAREVNTDTFEQQSDHLHFDGAGQLALGEAFYTARQSVGTPGADSLTGGNGADALNGFKGNDLVQGLQGNDTLLGGQGDDTVRGGQGADIVQGGQGNDWLSGDKGDDTLTGGAGADTFHMSATYGHDVVTDFSLTDGDTVQLDIGQTYTLAYSGNDTIVDLGNSDTLTLQNTHLTAGGWIFSA